MDTYFQREWHLPTELVRLIFSFATLRQDLVDVQLRSLSVFGANNLASYRFFSHWQFIADRAEDGTHYVRDAYDRVRVIYFLS